MRGLLYAPRGRIFRLEPGTGYVAPLGLVIADGRRRSPSVSVALRLAGSVHLFILTSITSILAHHDDPVESMLLPVI